MQAASAQDLNKPADFGYYLIGIDVPYVGVTRSRRNVKSFRFVCFLEQGRGHGSNRRIVHGANYKKHGSVN